MREIIFKVSEFPRVSETFIIQQIILAINLGYSVKILTRTVLPSSLSSRSNDIIRHNLISNVIIEDYKIPSNKFLRIINWMKMLFNSRNNLKKVLNYHQQKSRFSLTWLYELNFFDKYKNTFLFHVQYGTNKYPLDDLKAIGFSPNVICSFHGHDAIFPINGFIKNNHYYDKLFCFSDGVISNTEFLTNLLINLGCPPNKIRQIPIPVNTEFFRPELKSSKEASKIFRLITIGRLHASKGHVYMINALNKLIKSITDVHLTIIGSGPENDALNSLIDEYNLKKNISLVGSKSPDEIVALLQRSDLFLFTSISNEDGLSTETQGVSIVEAMSCGLPVICFDTGGVKYTFENGKSGFLIDEFDVNQMVEKILFFINRRDQLSLMGLNARAFAKEKFDISSITETWKRIYSDLY
ncbi:glycosyltransferase [Flavobacteriaceae bacterium]|nr:glycosyltransferase [Flavobacteriaceae bacterium]